MSRNSVIVLLVLIDLHFNCSLLALMTDLSFGFTMNFVYTLMFI